MKPDEKLPVYLLAAPIGENAGDMSITVLKLVGALRTLMVEDTGDPSPDDLIEKLKRKDIIKDGQRIIPMSHCGDVAGYIQVADECVANRKPFGIIADSGICCFIDPGIEVVRHLVDNHLDKVELVPVGASSALDAAIMMSGVDCTNFVFMGHFPETVRWFADDINDGVPGICYVRGDSFNQFVEQAGEYFGPDSGVFASVFKNIRANARRAHKRFALPASLELINGLAKVKDRDGHVFHDNFVVILDKELPA